MNKKMLWLYIIIFLNSAEINAINFIEENIWNEGWFDLRMIDIPKIGYIYDIDIDNNLLFRISAPLPFPVLFITPINVTYANSYWGIEALLLDGAFGMNIPEIKISAILLRFLPISIWRGLPLSSRGMGIYILLEIVPFNIFNNSIDNYQKKYFGIGINTGIKYIISKHIELELKYENYFAYNDIKIWNKYIGVTFKYRIFEPGYYGIW
ncbi:hypothetical protein FACS1894172_18730 [Spirochaetia bacterium]|nr:hypothetical protein FACS1894172_18730 [Spirochaetia bacterium]